MGELFMSFMLGTVGLAYFVYGRKQRRIAAMVSGVGLMVVPYFVDNLWVLGGVSAALLGLPFVWGE